MPSFLITGASRGIGLGLVSELLKDPKNSVLATARNPASAKGLQDLAAKYPKERLTLLTLDVTSPEQIANAAKETAKIFPNGLDYFIHNAGYWEQAFTPVEQLDSDAFQKEIAFYTVPVVHILREFKSLVQKSSAKKFIFISTIAASLTLVPNAGVVGIPYSVGKVAQNMLVRKWGIVNKDQGTTVAIIHPGFVDTDMGQAALDYFRAKDPNAKPTSVHESVDGVLKVSFAAKLEETTSFWSYSGDVLPW
ncbi:NAD(P)-binding protein [Panus rudis PR-1116 ss-1]|nr:NAD(P)-binding protein [Panus rudis PR-1116 ss-1]